MITTVLLWGLAAGIVHFVVIGIPYGNPLTERLSAGAEAESPAVRKWLLENTGLLPLRFAPGFSAIAGFRYGGSTPPTQPPARNDT